MMAGRSPRTGADVGLGRGRRTTNSLRLATHSLAAVPTAFHADHSASVVGEAAASSRGRQRPLSFLNSRIGKLQAGLHVRQRDTVTLAGRGLSMIGRASVAAFHRIRDSRTGRPLHPAALFVWLMVASIRTVDPIELST